MGGVIFCQMNSNVPRSEIQIPGVSSQSVQSLIPARSENEPPDLKTLIVERQVAALARYPADKLRDTARVCLDMARTHPQEVTVLLWKPEVAREAMVLLRYAQETATPEEASKALAHALLQAGHDLTGRAWPASVLELLQNRKKDNVDYWASKVQKFRGHPVKDDLPCFKERGLPFLSLSKQKSAVNLNARLGEAGKRFVCAHLALAIQDNPKAFLTRISQRDVGFLDRTVLNQRHRESRSRLGLSAVQFTPENFGRLLVRVACGVPWGGVRSFEVSYTLVFHIVSLQQRLRLVDRKMRAMPEALSSTFEAYIEEGLTYEQAAKSLRIPIGTVRSRIFRVRELVQDC